MDQADAYKSIDAAKISEAKKPAEPVMASKNPFDAMDMNCSDFEQGVRKLGQLLNIAHHPDHTKVFLYIHFDGLINIPYKYRIFKMTHRC